jgi:ubiquitin-protein ligase
MESKNLKRIWKEIDDVNADFFNLRTVISPDPDDVVTRFSFVMLPNDGAMAHLTLVGAMHIPDTYPVSPPAVHLYTKTGRYNVDVFQWRMTDKNSSTLCFNILRAKANGGTWTETFTISALFASLMSAIVSFYVPQENGPDRPEYVSMEKLRDVKRYAKESYDAHKHGMPAVPRIPLVEATMNPADTLEFPQEIIAGEPEKVTAGPIFLQDKDSPVYSFAVDLSELHEGIIFSLILTNSETDLVGKLPETVLIRNGVTATAARKRANQATKWFYHGKPMNDGDMRLHVTIGADQMTLTYYSNGRRYIHGDCPLSRLTASEIGDVRGVPFYVHIYTKRKSGPPAKIHILDIDGKGYLYQDSEDRDRDDLGFEIVDHSDDYEVLSRHEDRDSESEDGNDKQSRDSRCVAEAEQELWEELDALKI